MRPEKQIGVLDFETDPFLAGRIPLPFACCVYFSDQDFSLLWESDSRIRFIDRVVNALRKLPKCTLFAHNGGRFDYHYLLAFANVGSIEIRNGRVTTFRIGKVTLKDSFPLMPFALDEFKKDAIDYAIFEKPLRDIPIHRERISDYLLNDCRYLLELLTGFRAVVGAKETIGSAAFYQMRSLGIRIESMNEQHDSQFRSYYFGGRVQAFQKGVFNGPLQYYDINSAYPDAMRREHPHGASYQSLRELPSLSDIGPCFVRCIATSNRALPLRAKDGSLAFPNARAEFAVTGWEIAAGIETGTLKIERLLECWKPTHHITFKHYVDHFFALRSHAKNTGDEVRRLAYKYLLNSGYGKFAQNPREFKEYTLAPMGKNVPGYEWETDFGDISLWSRDNYKGDGFYDVATGASITGCVRATLWRAICAATGALYVDTDALLCESANIPLGDSLGQWKLEGIAKQAVIAGKKLYALEWETPVNGERYKIASKGARLSYADLISISKGDSILWENDAPTFSIGGASFISRTMRAT
jgi:DNA polymerase elongation subunit (family B)